MLESDDITGSTYRRFGVQHRDVLAAVCYEAPEVKLYVLVGNQVKVMQIECTTNKIAHIVSRTSWELGGRPLSDSEVF